MSKKKSLRRLKAKRLKRIRKKYCIVCGRPALYKRKNGLFCKRHHRGSM